jgi:hypothetical protein
MALIFGLCWIGLYWVIWNFGDDDIIPEVVLLR